MCHTALSAASFASLEPLFKCLAARPSIMILKEMFTDSLNLDKILLTNSFPASIKISSLSAGIFAKLVQTLYLIYTQIFDIAHYNGNTHLPMTFVLR